MHELIGIIVPIGICVVLPIVIVWIVFNSINNSNNRQSEIIIEAIKTNPNIDTEKLLEAFKTEKATPWVSLNRKLLRGSIFTLLGVVFAVIGAVIADYDLSLGCWMLCGVSASVGIGFLIAYIFSYKHIDQLTAEQRK